MLKPRRRFDPHQPELPGFGKPHSGTPANARGPEFKTPLHVMRTSPLFTEKRNWKEPPKEAAMFDRKAAISGVLATPNKRLLKFQAEALLRLAYARLMGAEGRRDSGTLPDNPSAHRKDIGPFFGAIKKNRFTSEMAGKCIRECWEALADTMMGEREIQEYLKKKEAEFAAGNSGKG